MTAWTLTPPWPKPPLSMNDRLHRMAEYTQQQAIRQTAAMLARSARIPECRHIEVAMIWTVPDERRRDDENPVATLKPFCDGLVDAGVVPDDTAEFMTKLMPRIEYAKGRKGVRFVVRSVPVIGSCRPASPLAHVRDGSVTGEPGTLYNAPGASGGDAA